MHFCRFSWRSGTKVTGIIDWATCAVCSDWWEEYRMRSFEKMFPVWKRVTDVALPARLSRDTYYAVNLIPSSSTRIADLPMYQSFSSTLMISRPVFGQWNLGAQGRCVIINGTYYVLIAHCACKTVIKPHIWWAHKSRCARKAV